MKKLTILTAFFACFSLFQIQAQNDEKMNKTRFDIKEVSKEMSEGLRAALQLSVPDAENVDVSDLWKDYMKQYDAKTKKGLFSSEYHTEKAHIYSVGGVEPVDVFANIDEKKGVVTVLAWFKLGENDFVNSNSHPDPYVEAVQIMDNFGLIVRKKALELKVEVEKEKLEELEEDLKDLKEDKKDLEEKIVEAKNTITESEKGITKNEENQKALAEKLSQQQKALEQAREKYQAAGQ